MVRARPARPMVATLARLNLVTLALGHASQYWVLREAIYVCRPGHFYPILELHCANPSGAVSVGVLEGPSEVCVGLHEGESVLWTLVEVCLAPTVPARIPLEAADLTICLSRFSTFPLCQLDVISMPTLLQRTRLRLEGLPGRLSREH